MLVRIADYVASAGGGVRFVVEAVRGLVAAEGGGDAGAAPQVEVWSHGAALDVYRRALAGLPAVRFVDRPARNQRLARRRGLGAVPLLGETLRALHLGGVLHYELPADVDLGCDLLWLPWLQAHRSAGSLRCPTVGSLHDVIVLQFPESFGAYVESEWVTTRHWLRSSARLVVSSEATIAALGGLFGDPPSRFDMIRVGTDHIGRHIGRGGEAAAPPPPVSPPFLLCPANFSPHKNHEVLLEGFGRFRRGSATAAGRSLVLTGSGADLEGVRPSQFRLRRAARDARLRLGADLHALGLVDEATYGRLLAAAWAVVMPTLAEGGGSFPVLEALAAGVPAVCSDIPVLREMMAWHGGEVLWFDPRDPRSLCAALERLERDEAAIRARAARQAASVRPRPWREVGGEYRRLFARVLAGGGEGDAVVGASGVEAAARGGASHAG